jgi:uncharacterized ferritin-like protein (DUF455 family)
MRREQVFPVPWPKSMRASARGWRIFSAVTEMRDIAERVLFAETLEEKLQPGPLVASDMQPGRAIALPDGPGRPQELRVRSNGVRVDFPGEHHLDDARERGVMLHFLANHELLAAELMALVLLRFPDAPKEYRAGVYEAMREEQAHAMMYLRRMRECGIHFGELPVNDHFWRICAPMETPLDFVTRLNLTFEQANLDFSKHYATLFRRVGDTATAAVLEKIHLDEIGHVGHGLKWFRKWKAHGESDWDAYRSAIHFPLTPARAKGLAPFNAESRRLAGLDEDFIRRLEVCEVSRGRTPVVHWFNPGAEAWARAAHAGLPWTPDRTALALEADLELLMIGPCKRDDALLVRREPAVAHLQALKAAGFDPPEILTAPAAPGRKLGGLRPWAWSPDAITTLAPLAGDMAENSPHPWRGDAPVEWFSKEIGLRLEHELGPCPETGVLLRDADEVVREIDRHLLDGQALLKQPFACAGRGHLRVNRDSRSGATRGWIDNTLRAHGAVVVERWLDRVHDFSALYEIRAGGMVEWIGMTRMENDAAGRFTGIRVNPKWGNLLEPGLAGFLFREARAMQIYQHEVPQALARVLPGYAGPLCVDAMVHRRGDGALALKPVVELNVRMTMGRLAWEWMKRGSRQGGGVLRILRKAEIDGPAMDTLRREGVFLNDAEAATLFLAHWSAHEHVEPPHEQGAGRHEG